MGHRTGRKRRHPPRKVAAPASTTDLKHRQVYVLLEEARKDIHDRQKLLNKRGNCTDRAAMDMGKHHVFLDIWTLFFSHEQPTNAWASSPPIKDDPVWQHIASHGHSEHATSSRLVQTTHSTTSHGASCRSGPRAWLRMAAC